MNDFRITELERRVSNLIKSGIVESIDYIKYKCRVRINGVLLTDPIPWIECRAGKNRTWNPPSLGEQVVVFCPSGELDNGYVLTGVNLSTNTPPSTDEFVHQITYFDGTVISYDRGSHSLNITQPAIGSSLNITVAGNTTINSTGNTLIEASGNATLSAGLIARIEAGTEIQIVAPLVNVTSTIISSGDVVAGGKSLMTHKHSGVRSGGDQTGTPV
jgi:phage baseplate assembly protein V